MLLFRLKSWGLILAAIFCASSVHAECPAGYEEMLSASVNGKSQIKIDWIGKKAVTPEGVVSVAGGICYAESGKKCVGDGFSVVLNTGSETETIEVDGDANKKYNICMNSCYRTKEEQPNSNDSPDWKEIDSCKAEFEITAVTK